MNSLPGALMNHPAEIPEQPREEEMERLVGVDIGGTQIKMGAFSSQGALIGQSTRETEDRPTTGVPAFAAIVREMLREANAASKIRVGIAAPGIASRDGRSIAYQPGKMHGIEGFDWSNYLGREVPVLNDAHAALLGEVWQGAAKGANDAVLLTLGTGVGGAILSHGRLMKGSFGRAGSPTSASSRLATLSVSYRTVLTSRVRSSGRKSWRASRLMP